VQQFISADARLPSAVALPAPADRQVARELEMRRDFAIIDVIDALGPQSQTDLLCESKKDVNADTRLDGEQMLNDVIISPVASQTEA
jgi:hypothetical protein